MIEVAGIQVRRRLMIEVAHRLVLAGDLKTATRALDGCAHHDLVTLEIADREAVSVLTDGPDDLLELRATLLQEHAGRKPEGLA